MGNYLNGMMGLVVGDALGVPVQFMTREEIENRKEGPVTKMEAGGVYDMPEGTWSDDSSMAIATLVSILECGTLEPSDVMLKFVRWELKGEYTPFGEAFDEGNTCSFAIYDFIDNPDVTTCGRTGEYANGNGALMRILPACIFYYNRQASFKVDMTKEAIAGIDMVSALTHNHKRSKMACGLYYFLVKEILDNKDTKKLNELLQNGIDNGLKFYGKDISNLTEMAHFGRLFHLNEFEKLEVKEIKSSGYVIDSFEAALWCLLNTNSYKDCMLKAVNLGDDTDTVAAIAGGLAGLYYGYESIPKEWLLEIKRREWIENMCAEADEDISRLDNYIADIHMHVIPNVDDGSESIEMSMEMLRSSYIQGVRKVFCTSHGGVFYDDDRDVAKKYYEELIEKCAVEMPDMKLYFGAEVRMLPDEMDAIMQMLEDKTMPTLAGTNYVLAEYIDGFFITYEDILSSIKRLKEAGYIPIIAHVERYYTVIPDIKAAKKLHDEGCYFQINAYSIVEDSDPEVIKRTKELLDAGLVDFIGSDAHRTYHRPPMVIMGIKHLYKNYDKEYVDKIVFRNVEKLILGE